MIRNCEPNERKKIVENPKLTFSCEQQATKAPAIPQGKHLSLRTVATWRIQSCEANQKDSLHKRVVTLRRGIAIACGEHSSIGNGTTWDPFKRHDAFSTVRINDNFIQPF